MSEIKQVKVDNWGIYFLQRLKHFFNRTDYCDLTLQFQDNAQLKVHRLVLSACTEYFELLERTCEMYEDCLVMPDDLQADVVVPIVNFMYTGQLDFKSELLERLHQTSQVMNMPVLTKLLDAHRNQQQRLALTHDYRNIKSYSKTIDSTKNAKSTAVASTSCISTKRSYSKAFDNSTITSKSKKQSFEKVASKSEKVSNNSIQQTLRDSLDTFEYPVMTNKKQSLKDPRPTRYELPEELDVENVFDNSFTSISYTSTPLMVHPETIKRYTSKKNNIFDETSSCKRFVHGRSTLECKKVLTNDNIFDDDESENVPDDIFPSNNSKEDQKNASQLFDQILESKSPKSTIEIKDTDRNKPKLDHAKIISEVLKKYPHLVKSNKNIKLKILNTSSKSKKSKTATNVYNEEKELKPKIELPDFTYETDVLDSKEAAKLIAMGAENIKGPWICLICGTPGRALHFTSYFKFRRHLVDVHNEKPMPNICEYCGLKSLKRNYILHHLYSKHGVEPPSSYHFPKCNSCNYVALTEAYLVKHKLTHVENKHFGCNVCAASFNSSNQLLVHIQKTGHKYSAEKKTNLQCIYCLKTFSRETNLYTHIKIYHKQSAQSDGIIDESEEEKEEVRLKKGKSDNINNISVKYELPAAYESEYENLDVQYQIQQKPDGNIHVLSKSPQTSMQSGKHKILNPGFNSSTKVAQKSSINNINKQELQEPRSMPILKTENDGVVVIDGSEYIVKDNQLVPRTQNTSNEQYLLTNDIAELGDNNSISTSSIEFPTIQHSNTEESKMIIKNAHMNQPIQIVVSNEEEYKALMSSNHSIIFGEGDPSKTLTVLSAPQNSALEGTSIDLDTQPNDMMIIQENYPLSVTETVTADNSNIVVVYSDQNKQFQYITSQGIEAQFIPSSAMLTHNYETVTTSTSIMSANVESPNIENSWKNDMKQNIEKIPMESPLKQQVEEIQEQPLIENSQSSLNNIHGIEEISLPNIDTSAVTADVNNTKEIITKISEPTNNTNNMDQVLIQEVHNISSLNLNINVPNEQLLLKEMQTESINNENCEQVEVLENNIEDKNNKLVDHKHNEMFNVMEKIGQKTIITTNLSKPIEQNTCIVQENSIPEDNVVTNDTQIIELPMSNIEVRITKVSTEHIKNFTSEWSEDKNNKVNTVTVPQCNLGADDSVYLEESIENIQQEMAKQMEAIENNTAQYQQSQTIGESKAIIDAIESITDTELLDDEIGPETTLKSYFSSVESKFNTAQTNKKIIILKNEKLNPLSISTTVETQISNDGILKNTFENVKCYKENINHACPIIEGKLTGKIDDENVNVHTNIIDVPTENEKVLSPKKEAEIEESASSSQEVTSNQPKQHTVITLNKTAHDKISSLLNDWEENDSHEDGSKKDNELELVTEKNEMKEETNQEIEDKKKSKPSTDNIKSLVSDWDDDEDETK